MWRMTLHRMSLALVVLLLLLAAHTDASAIYHPAPDTSYSPPAPQPNIERIQQLLEELESGTDGITMQVASLADQVSSSDGQMHRMSDLFLPAAHQQNSAQDRLTEAYKHQIKHLRHRVGDAIAEAAEASDLATSTTLDTSKLLTRLNSQLTDINDSQQVDIDRLKMECQEVAQDAQDAAAAALTAIRASLSMASDSLQAMMGRLNARHCEYGSGSFHDGKTTVHFTSNFIRQPKVILGMTGFVAHYIDQSASTHNDCLGFDQYVTDVTTDSFVVNMQNLTGGSVELQKIYSSWSACLD